MSLYATGTITGALNATTITGTGTKWSDAKLGITNGSVLFISSNAGVDGVYQVKRVISDTSIELAQPIFKAFNASKYSIMVAESASTAAWSNQLAATLGYYQAQMDGWQQIMTGTGDVALTAPDGTKVTIKSFTKMSQDIDKKQDKSDILTDLSKSKDADGVREYLGLNESLNEKADKSALGSAASKNAGANIGDVALVHGGRGASANQVNKTWDGIYEPFVSGGLFPDSCVIQVLPGPTTSEWGGVGIGYGYAHHVYVAKASYSSTVPTGNITVMEMLHDKNTTVDSGGFIKRASPIIKIFHDGGFETNAESEGAKVERVSIGIYRITNVLGMNSDGSWGGIDGGFEVPTDRNGQRLLWLDYKVEANGSILVKTYHRTYPDAPTFARNIKDGYEEGAPIDIPSDQFLSVRVEMPQDSIWNLAQKVAQEAMEQEKTVEG